MKKVRAAAGFVGVSIAVSAAGVSAAAAILDGRPWCAAAAGVGIGWSSSMAGFSILLANVDRSGNRFLGAFAAGLLLRLAALSCATWIAISGLLPAEPLLVALALTVFTLLMTEGAVFWAASG